MSTIEDSPTELEGKFGLEPEVIRPDATMNELGMDSLAQAELVATVRDAFAAQVTHDKVGPASTVADDCAAVRAGACAAGSR
ncbi:acyl carrier protein [Streptomyces sp. NPDC003011]